MVIIFFLLYLGTTVPLLKDVRPPGWVNVVVQPYRYSG